MASLIRFLRWGGIFVFAILILITLHEFLPKVDDDAQMEDVEGMLITKDTKRVQSTSTTNTTNGTNVSTDETVSHLSITIKRRRDSNTVIPGQGQQSVANAANTQQAATSTGAAAGGGVECQTEVGTATKIEMAAKPKLIGVAEAIRAAADPAKPSLAGQRLAMMNRPNVYVEGMEVVAGPPGKHCIATCGITPSVLGVMNCEEEALMFHSVDNCETMKRWYPCKSCVVGVEPGTPLADGVVERVNHAPYYNITTGVCVVNGAARIWQNGRPKCEANAPNASRLCVCMNQGMYQGAKTDLGKDGILRPARRGIALGRMLPVDFPSLKCPCNPASTIFTPQSDLACRAYLSNDGNIERMIPLKSKGVDARTIKWKAEYKKCGIKALIKSPQAYFSWEAVNEVACYHLDRWMDLRMIPPTQFLQVPVSYLRTTLKGYPEDHAAWFEKDCFTHSIQRKFVLNDVVANQSDVMTLTAQLFLDDINQFHISLFSLPNRYEKMYNAHAPILADYLAANLTLAQTSDIAVFDYILGNIDRGRVKNLFVAGGCLHTIENCTDLKHVGVPRIVMLDQGWSFYQGLVPPISPLNPNNENKWHMCRFTEEMVNFVLSAEGVEAEDVGVSRSKAKGSIAMYSRGTIAEVMIQNLPDKVMRVMPIPRDRYQIAHLRLRDVVVRMQECERVYGRAETRFWRRYPTREMTDGDSIRTILTEEQAERIAQKVFEVEVKPWVKKKEEPKKVVVEAKKEEVKRQ